MPEGAFLSGDAVPDYLRGVELMTAGMEWPSMNGPITVTMAHLADAVRAANDDPHIQQPRIKLGHTSAVNGDHPDYDPFAAVGDAEPAFGVFTNLRLANDGAVLLGDAENVPAWLAEAALTAYPNRSAEATWDVTPSFPDAPTNGGRRYQMVVTAVSLLGVYAPAISDLEDLQTLIMSGPAALTASQSPALAAAKDGAALSVSYDTVRARFNWNWAYEREGNDVDEDTTWWWARDVRFDPNEIIADDDDGNLWSVPFTTDGEDAVTFGEPKRVRETFVPLAAAQKVASFARPSMAPRKLAAATAASDNAAVSRPDPEEGANMDADVREILEGLGLDPATATEMQVKSATAQAVIDRTSPAPLADEVPEPSAEAEPVTEAAPERVPVAAAAAPDPLAAAKDKVISDLSAEVADLRKRENTRLAAEVTTRRDGKVLAALTAGRITPAEREHYRGLMDIDEGKTDALLSVLSADRVPLAARSLAPDPEAEAFPTDAPLPEGVSLLNPTQRRELAARRG